MSVKEVLSMLPSNNTRNETVSKKKKNEKEKEMKNKTKRWLIENLLCFGSTKGYTLHSIKASLEKDGYATTKSVQLRSVTPIQQS